ncbi:rRNA maturation RNase YbeY [Acidocella sp. KAb 2-4]|uniref:rRNA maturation RNase YbeY n=1 Tax=Acidocella sp. KAb 2-4 TaxID=2885158 RepID=UPI001D05CFA3|nr:rRNA maturation RNase YbeY [Acidocella sp. KAb 2-4]MCB5944148.1 rRNA maturation RNase YbeY [Acidocella sp. KAb 2-4]
MEPGSTSPFGGPEIIVADRRWRRHVRHLPWLIRRTLAAAESGASVVLADDRTIKRLNHRDRGKNKPTNVLTYANPPEMLLAFGVVAAEAAREGKSIARHLQHLLVHGALHLHGFDHHHAGEAREMEAAETRILARLGVPNPWKNR